MIIAGEARGWIEGLLRRNQVPFSEYEQVKISKENANSKSPDIRVPKREPNLIYNP
jgi:hypothetical protein